MGILSFLGFGDDEEEKTTAVANATTANAPMANAPVANAPAAPTMNNMASKMIAPSNMAGGRRRKHRSKKHRKSHRRSKRHSRRH